MNTHFKPASRGFTLVEAMVALVVLSVGMIGMAALHGQGLSASRTAVYRTQAVTLVSDIADRIRANRLGQAAYEGAGADNGCGINDCTPAQMAAHDLLVWRNRVEEILPNAEGKGEVAFDPNTLPPSYTITVGWDEVGQGAVEHEVTIRVPAT